MNYVFAVTFLFLVSNSFALAQPKLLQAGAPRPVLSAQPAAAAQSSQTEAGAPAVPQTAGTGEVSSSYVIGPDDSIQVTVWKEPGLSGSFPVRPDGMISLSLVGDIPAAGRTPMQLGSDITTLLKKYMTDPSVSVTVLSVNSKHIFMLGEVGHVGAVPLAPGMTPLQAIAMSGGLTPYANKKRIYILRGAKPNQKKIPFDYAKAIKSGDLQGVELQPGDTIVVP